MASVAALACGGGGDPAAGLASDAAKAKDLRAYASVQQGLADAALVRAESGGYGSGTDDLVARLKARDGSKTFTTAASDGPESIQVTGGGSSPVMLVVKSPADNYLGGWTDGANTRYYRGTEAPAPSATAPEGGGWSAQPPL